MAFEERCELFLCNARLDGEGHLRLRGPRRIRGKGSEGWNNAEDLVGVETVMLRPKVLFAGTIQNNVLVLRDVRSVRLRDVQKMLRYCGTGYIFYALRQMVEVNVALCHILYR